jgi:hypothetical protein
MNETGRPRHIRDIAHVYLSRLRSDFNQHNYLIISGETRDGFAAFHTANLVTAFAVLGARSGSRTNITVFDVSEVLPNVGFFLAMPPRAYVHRSPTEARKYHSTVMDIKLCFSFPESPRERRLSGGPSLDVICLPPTELEVGFENSLVRSKSSLVEGAIFLLMRNKRRRSVQLEDLVIKHLGMVPIYVLDLEDGIQPNGCTANEFYLGNIAEWRENLTDRVPCVLRESQSRLACSYFSLAESVLFKMRMKRRLSNAACVDGCAPGIESS